eukprot:scaffold34477_cov19-Prasinocladus_malaysianus.AAC.1
MRQTLRAASACCCLASTARLRAARSLASSLAAAGSLASACALRIRQHFYHLFKTIGMRTGSGRVR